MDAFIEQNPPVEFLETREKLSSLFDIDIPQTGKNSQNNKISDQASRAHAEKPQTLRNVNKKPDNLTLAEYAESTYPLGALAFVSD